MPRSGTRFLAGMAAGLALLLLGGCSAMSSGSPSPTPSASESAVSAPVPTPSGVAWAEDLTFSGELTGHMTGIVPNEAGQRSQCTGPGSKSSGQWALKLFGQVANGVYGLVVTANPYRGPGAYTAVAAKVQVFSADQQQVWQSQAGDPVSFSVANDEETGSLDTVLTNLADGKTKMHVTGTWSCRA